MRYTQELDVPKSEFIKKIKVKGLPDKDERYVLVHANGKKEIVPVTRENSNAIDLQLQEQVSSGIKAIPEIEEEIDKYFQRGESYLKTVAGFTALQILNQCANGPDGLTNTLTVSSMYCGIKVIGKLVQALNKNRVASQILNLRPSFICYPSSSNLS